MAEQPDNRQVDNDDDVSENYKPPAEVSLNELVSKDAEDESLQRYKAALLGHVASGDDAIPFPNDPKRVILQKLTMLSPGRPIQELDFTTDQKKKPHLEVREGSEYQLKVDFYVQREIVAGLKYEQKTYKMGARVDKSCTMIGSFGPSKELKSFTTKVEEAPKGMLARGSYSVKSAFVDDDKNKYVEWEWSLDIVKA